MENTNSRAIVLKRTAYGEADWVVRFFSRDMGSLTGFAKSARRSQKRFAGALEPGTLVDLSFAEGRGSMVRIEEARVARPSEGILKSLERIGAMHRALSLALVFIKEGQVSPERFDLLDRWLEIISSRDPNFTERIFFELEWLKFSGFAPKTNGCVMCELEADAAKWFFDFEHGGLVCASCAAKFRGERVTLSKSAVLGFKSVSENESGADAKAGVELTDVISRYVNHIVGHPLASCLF